MLVVGLTGTIASGKSTTAAMFAEEGIPVFSADAAVHDLYRGRAAGLIGQAFPGVLAKGEVDRARLAEQIERRPEAIARLESVIHPMVRQEQEAFLKREAAAGRAIVVLELPLLFETHAETGIDKVVVTTASAATRRKRALSRPRMTPAMYRLLGARQWSDRQKRRRADYVVDTGPGLEAAREAVGNIVRALRAMAPAPASP